VESKSLKYNKPLLVTEVTASLNHEPYTRYLNMGGIRGYSHLDLGAGNGNNILFSQSLGLNTVGIEYDIDYCRLLKGSKVIRATVDHLPFASNSFFIISLMHVLEHLPQYKETLIDISRSLRQDGYFIVEVPNKYSLQELFNFFYGKIVINDSNRHLGHCNYFSYKGLRKILELLGYEVIDFRITGGLLSSTYSCILLNLQRMWLFIKKRRLPDIEDNKIVQKDHNSSILSTMRKIDKQINKHTFLFVEFFGFICRINNHSGQ
jgi:SAM-dependent methyltransferase